MIQIIALNVQKINISEKGTLLSTNTTERLKERGIKFERTSVQSATFIVESSIKHWRQIGGKWQQMTKKYKWESGIFLIDTDR